MGTSWPGACHLMGGKGRHETLQSAAASSSKLVEYTTLVKSRSDSKNDPKTVSAISRPFSMIFEFQIDDSNQFFKAFQMERLRGRVFKVLGGRGGGV